MRNFLLWASSLVLMAWGTSCQDKPSEEQKGLKNQATGILQASELNVVSDSLGAVSNLLVVDSFLVYKDYKRNPLYGLYDLKKDRLISTFGEVGEGPGEFDPYAYLQNMPGRPGEIGFCLRLKFRYRSAQVADLMAQKEIYTEGGVNLPTEFQQCVPMPSGHYLGVGIFNGRYAFADPTGELLPPQLGFPFADKTGEMSFGSKAMLFQGKLLVRPDGKRTLFAYSSFPGWEICKVEGLKLEKASQNMQAMPSFEDATGGQVLKVVLTQDNVEGYVGASANQELVVLLLSGRSERAHPRKSSLANQLQVLDWDGKLLASYTLDRDLSSIAVDSEGKTVYGFAPGEQPKMVAYRLPQSF